MNFEIPSRVKKNYHSSSNNFPRKFNVSALHWYTSLYVYSGKNPVFRVVKDNRGHYKKCVDATRMPPRGLQSWNMGLVKNCLTPMPKIIRPDPNSNSTCVFSWHIYISNFNSKCQFEMEIMSGNWKLMEFSKSKGHNSAKNYSTGPKFELKLRILMTHLYTAFQFKMSIWNGDNERKLKINGIFLSARGITLPKIIRPNPNSNSTCVFSWHIYIPNFNWKCQFVVEIIKGNCKLMEFF